jgi:type IX secretion system PorP/SprF family membrane protein
MRNLYKHIVFILICFAASSMNAQQIPLYSKYFMNRYLINPARAGAYGYTILDLTAREQWLGFKGAPRTHTISFQTRLLKKSYMGRARTARRKYSGRRRSGRVGVGAFIFNDRAALLDYSGFVGTYAYHIKMQQMQLSFGMSMSLFQFKVREEDVILYNPSDKLLDNNKLSSYVPDATFGVYYTFPNFYAGLSSTQLFQSALRFGNSNLRESKMIRHYYGMSGYNYEIDKYYSVEPSVLIKTNEYLHSQIDLNVRGFYRDDYWLGLSYRTGGRRLESTKNGGAIVFMGGVSVDMFHFAYAFDYTLNSLRKYSWGSHEINIAVHFGDNARRYRWLDRF